jgi:hypothetical protein
VIPDIATYNAAAPEEVREVCDWLAGQIEQGLTGAEAKVWHRTAVWFLAGNPIAGYAPRKAGVQLLFWSGQSFDEPGLKPEGKFKAAEVNLRKVGDVEAADLARWLDKARRVQWDYANVVKRRGVLEKLGDW